MEGFGILLATLAAIGIAYRGFAFLVLGRFFAAPLAPAGGAGGGITILKPLYGDEPRLQDNLATFLAQDYAGPVQLLCGVGSADDPARLAVEALQRAHPHADIALVVDPTRHGANAKVGNLINMLGAARHGTLVLSDSDMSVGPDYLATLTATLAQPGVGAATCFYRGRGDGGFWSRVSAGIISHVALPDMVVGYASGLAKPCMGSTIALTRETLDAIGGFARFADVLADDHAIGAAIAQQGLAVAIPPLLLTHACAEGDFAAVWRQKLRWAVTIRGLQPWGYAGSIVTRPLPLALLAALFIPETGLVLSVTALALRLAVARRVDRIAGTRSVALWLLPMIDLVDFLVFAASFTVRKIDWRGTRLAIEPDGRIAA
ncbi:MAG: bacteriohopanetetrol glucosamine biosynthesis glycosyltransferase HpnI [Novosphingobium sp.]